MMTDAQWRTHVTAAAARAIGTWLEARGRLHQPIRALTQAELTAMADAAVSRFVVLASERIGTAAQPDDDLTRLLMASGSAPSAADRPAASATSTSSGTTATPTTGSARRTASTLVPRSPGGGSA